ncbi:hypothetical protein FALCPG4_004100 [Fusarium falciforme]
MVPEYPAGHEGKNLKVSISTSIDYDAAHWQPPLYVPFFLEWAPCMELRDGERKLSHSSPRPSMLSSVNKLDVGINIRPSGCPSPIITIKHPFAIASSHSTCPVNSASSPASQRHRFWPAILVRQRTARQKRTGATFYQLRGATAPNLAYPIPCSVSRLVLRRGPSLQSSLIHSSH